MSETSGHDDCARVELTCGDIVDEDGKMVPSQQEVAGEGLTGALVELSLNESNESGRHVFLHRRLCSEE